MNNCTVALVVNILLHILVALLSPCILVVLISSQITEKNGTLLTDLAPLLICYFKCFH